MSKESLFNGFMCKGQTQRRNFYCIAVTVNPYLKTSLYIFVNIYTFLLSVKHHILISWSGRVRAAPLQKHIVCGLLHLAQRKRYKRTLLFGHTPSSCLYQDTTHTGDVSFQHFDIENQPVSKHVRVLG